MCEMVTATGRDRSAADKISNDVRKQTFNKNYHFFNMKC